jgi:hypothetical protein
MDHTAALVMAPDITLRRELMLAAHSPTDHTELAVQHKLITHAQELTPRPDRGLVSMVVGAQRRYSVETTGPVRSDSQIVPETQRV